MKIRTEHFKDPLYLAVGVLILSLVAQLLCFMVRPLAPDLIDAHYPWVVSTGMLIMYTLFNNVSALLTDNLLKHWQKSIYGFAALSLCLYLMSWLLSGIKLNEISGFKDIIFIVLIAFITLKVMATSIVSLIEFTKKNDKDDLLK